jgi:Mn-dependent DtxR family transcriptional regulator
VQLTQLQDEIIDAAHSEGQVDPATFARLLLHDLDNVHAANSDLAKRGLVTAAEGETYRLTDQGEAVHRAQEDAHRAAVISRTRSWQPR